MRTLASGGVPRVPCVANPEFRRTIGGYDRSQVDAAFSSAQSRIARLDSELAALSNRLADSERRLYDALARLGEADPSGTVAALTHAVDEVHQQARRQATRIRMRALEDAVAISERISQLAGIGEAAEGVTGNGTAFGERPAAEHGQDEPSVASAGEGGRIWSGRIEVRAGPIADFAQLTAIEDTLKGVGQVSSVSVRSVSDNWATLTVQLDGPADLIAEIRREIPFEVSLDAKSPDSLEIGVVDHESGHGDKELKAA